MRTACRVVLSATVIAAQSVLLRFPICLKIMNQVTAGDYIVNGGGHVNSPKLYLHRNCLREYGACGLQSSLGMPSLWSGIHACCEGLCILEEREESSKVNLENAHGKGHWIKHQIE